MEITQYIKNKFRFKGHLQTLGASVLSFCRDHVDLKREPKAMEDKGCCAVPQVMGMQQLVALSWK